MNKKFYYFTLAVALLSLNSCNNENEGKDTPSDSSKYISVSTQIADMTRVATNSNGEQEFENNDQISVYAWTGDKNTAPAKSERVVDNSINTLNGNSWVATPQMLWETPTDKHYFIGIWPSSATAIDDLTNGDYTFDVTNQSESDLLVAVNTNGLSSKDNPVPLVFDHVMAKLKVNLTYRNQWGGTPTIDEVTVDNVATKATVNYLTKVVTASDNNREKIKLPVVNENTSYTSIVIPQTGITTIDIKIGQSYFTYQHTNDIKLESGKYTTINLIVGRDKITLGSISISNWEEGERFDGEALN